MNQDAVLSQSNAVTPSPATPTASYKYAGFWKRVVAGLIDSAIVGAPLVVVIVLAVVAGMMADGSQGASTASGHAANAGLLIGASVGVLWCLATPFVYYGPLLSSPKMATWGKQAVGLVVTTEDGHRLSYGRAVGRTLLKWLFGRFVSILIYITVFFTSRKQTLYDMVVEVVVLERA